MTRAPTSIGDFATLRRETSAILWPPDAWVMWCDSLRITAVDGLPSVDRSEAVSRWMRDPVDGIRILVCPASMPRRAPRCREIICEATSRRSPAWESEFAATETFAARRGWPTGRPSSSRPTKCTGPHSSASAIAAASGSFPVPFAPRLTAERYSHLPVSGSMA